MEESREGRAGNLTMEVYKTEVEVAANLVFVLGMEVEEISDKGEVKGEGYLLTLGTTGLLTQEA